LALAGAGNQGSEAVDMMGGVDDKRGVEVMKNSVSDDARLCNPSHQNESTFPFVARLSCCVVVQQHAVWLLAAGTSSHYLRDFCGHVCRWCVVRSLVVPWWCTWLALLAAGVYELLHARAWEREHIKL
jgi:hypothetical protein